MNFASPVFLLKYYKDPKFTAEGLKKLATFHKNRVLAVDCALNELFVGPETEKAKFSNEFLKYCYGLEDSLQIIKLADLTYEA